MSVHVRWMLDPQGERHGTVGGWIGYTGGDWIYWISRGACSFITAMSCSCWPRLDAYTPTTDRNIVDVRFGTQAWSNAVQCRSNKIINNPIFWRYSTVRYGYPKKTRRINQDFSMPVGEYINTPLAVNCVASNYPSPTKTSY